MELSIIVPVYGVEAYLEKCLDSLVNQTLKDEYEIIVVNDGSPDNSQEIIDRYQKKYPQIKGYIKPNGGQSDARNFGIAKATGKYIGFVDSDDYIDYTMYEKLLNKAKEKDFDIVCCGFYEVFKDHQNIYGSRLKSDVFTVKKVMTDIYSSPWNKIYKRELIKDLHFKKGVWFEDVEWLYRLLPTVKTIGNVDEPLYFYLQRQGSITKSTDPRIIHCLENWDGLYEYYKENGLFEEYGKEFEFCYVRYVLATFLRASLLCDKETYNRYLKLAISHVKERYPHYRRNRYFYQSPKGIYLVMFNSFVGKTYYKLKNGGRGFGK